MDPAVVGNLPAPVPALLSPPYADLAPPARQDGVAASAPSQAQDPGLQLQCADVLPVRCEVSWRSTSRDSLVALACAHGQSAHGFTPAWYSPEQIEIMTAAVTCPT